MNIKQVIKFSFFVIILLIAILAGINTLVVHKIKENLSYTNKIHELVSFQSRMGALLKESINTEDLNGLNGIKDKFSSDEKQFEEVKRTLGSIHKKDFIEYFAEDIHVNSAIQHNLQLLSKNEKLLERSFYKTVMLQKERFFLVNRFNEYYPLENSIRKKIENKVLQKKGITLLKIFSNLQYYSKETLFQHKDKVRLNKWLHEIDNITIAFHPPEIDTYRDVVKKLGSYILQIEEIKRLESQLENEISGILTVNQQVNETIVSTIEDLSSQFVSTIYSIILLLAFFIIGSIIVLEYKVYGYIGLSVDEIEIKVQDGIKEVTKLNQEIETTQKEVVFTMGAIAESRSKETGNHVKRVAEYSKMLAIYYGLPYQEAEMLKRASPMHDIGKVAIPDAILNKPGRLTPGEFDIMRTHADLGHAMLKKSERPLLKMASIVAYEHHERWDGRGYPCGKKRDNIHIYGRITAIADVFDALGSDRVYKKAWGDESIIDFFKKEKGYHFEPRLVDIFFEHVDEFLEIRKQLTDRPLPI